MFRDDVSYDIGSDLMPPDDILLFILRRFSREPPDRRKDIQHVQHRKKHQHCGRRADPPEQDLFAALPGKVSPHDTVFDLFGARFEIETFSGIDPLKQRAAKLSGGERQRISIARALLKNAPIVLLDEATASLDVENETKVQGALSRLLAGKTVLVIAHRMRTVEAADKIVVLSDGKVAEEGSPAELFAKENSLFRPMAQLQNASAGWSI